MPKSRGRRPKRGGKRPVRRSPVPQRLSDVALRDARQITGTSDPLDAERWASGWLGAAWHAAPMGERGAEHQLCLEVAGRACTTPAPHGLAAVAALARVLPAEEKLLTGTVGILSETQPLPPWSAAGEPWTPVAAWRAVDVWDSERVLLIDYDGPHPHTLLAQVSRAGGIWVRKLAVLERGAASRWEELREPGEVPMPITALPPAEVLTELADALRTTDITWPRNDDDDYVDNRSLAWSRCYDYLPADWAMPEEPEDEEPEDEERAGGEPEELPEDEIRRLIDDFAAATGHGDEVSRSLAELFLQYGEEYIRSGPLAWSPDEVMLLLTDWLPRKAILDAAQREALPGVLREWLAFALTRRGTDPEWITPVVSAVDAHLREFRAAFDDRKAWGPAKQIAAELAGRGVNLGDREAVAAAMHSLNAERLARLAAEDDR